MKICVECSKPLNKKFKPSYCENKKCSRFGLFTAVHKDQIIFKENSLELRSN